MAENFDIHGTPGITDQHAFVMADVAKVEKAVPSGGGLICEESEEIVEPDEIVVENDKDWDLVGIMTAVEVEFSRPRWKMRALQKNRRSKNVDGFADMLAVDLLAEQILHSKRQVTEQEEAFVEVERKLHVACSAAFLRYHSALTKAEEARKCHEELEDAKELLGVAQIAANKAHDDAKTAKEEASIFQAHHVDDVGRRRDEAG